ncbi:MAG: outer membrane protein assembly factor BamD [Chitinophagaceae bacterium]|nr:outer membrane protein assembly factor BamD [Chitinophagaceae bacterium]
MRIIKSISAGLFLIFLISACNKFNKVLKSKDFEYKLTMADKYYADKKYKYAQQLYEELFPIFKGTQKFEELYYKYAYCFYYQKQYRDAENLFKGFLEVFPNSANSEEVDYMRAYCFYKQSPKVELEQTNTVKSMGMMQTFINTHPESSKVKDAIGIITLCRAKLESKEYNAAQLYYNLRSFRAAALSFSTLLNNYPESTNGEEYKLMVVKAYYKYAKMSITEKQIERFEKVISEYQDFVDRYPDSKLLKTAESYSNLSLNNIKEIKNEQTSSSVKR